MPRREIMRWVAGRSIRATAVLTAVAAVLFGLSITNVAPAPGLDGTRLEIDLHSGRLRSTRVLFGVPLRVVERETPLSRVLAPNNGPADGSLTWHPEDTQAGPSPVSMNTLQDIWDAAGFSLTQRRITARQLLDCWSESWDGEPAAAYLARLGMLAREGRSIGREDLAARGVDAKSPGSGREPSALSGYPEQREAKSASTTTTR